MKESLKCDFHIHTQYSDGRLTIQQVVDLYGSKGFGAIAITDHICEERNIIGRVSHSLNYSLSKENFSTYIQEIKHEALRAWEQYKMLVIPGFEITKNSFVNHRSAHILVLGVEEWIDPELDVEEILVWAKRQGGLTIAAHPLSTGEFEFQTYHLWGRRHEIGHLIDAWEMNSRQKVTSSHICKKSYTSFGHSIHRVVCSYSYRSMS